MRPYICLLVAAFVLSILAPAASACINDRVTTQVEEEFKSNYEFKPEYKEPDTTPEQAPLGPLASIAGVGLLAGAIVVGLVRSAK